MLAFTPSPYDYGHISPGQRASQTFILTNSGGSATGALTAELAGSAEFTITADNCTGTSLGPGKSCTVAVQFAPASAGTVTATLTAAGKKQAAKATDSLTGTGASASHIYWGSYTGIPDTGSIMEANLDGISPQTIITGQNPSLMAIDSSHIYWAEANGSVGSAIKRANLDGTGVTILANPADASGVAVDSSHIYWTEETSGTIMEANLDGTGVTTLIPGQNSPVGVAVNSSHIYWTNSADSSGNAADGSVMEANLDGTGVTTLISGQTAVAGVTVGP